MAAAVSWAVWKASLAAQAWSYGAKPSLSRRLFHFHRDCNEITGSKQLRGGPQSVWDSPRFPGRIGCRQDLPPNRSRPSGFVSLAGLSGPLLRPATVSALLEFVTITPSLWAAQDCAFRIQAVGRRDESPVGPFFK